MNFVDCIMGVYHLETLHNEGFYLLSTGGSQNKELKDFHKRQQMETVTSVI
jgi:hypothetical protein